MCQGKKQPEFFMIRGQQNEVKGPFFSNLQTKQKSCNKCACGTAGRMSCWRCEASIQFRTQGPNACAAVCTTNFVASEIAERSSASHSPFHVKQKQKCCNMRSNKRGLPIWKLIRPAQISSRVLSHGKKQKIG